MNPFVAFIKLIRLPNLFIIVLTQYAVRYGIIYPYGIELQMSSLHFFLLCLSTVMIAAAGYIINDYFDLRVDRINRPEKIIVGKYIKRRVAMGAHLVINILALAIAVYVTYTIDLKLLSIQLLSIIGLWYYSILFKKKVLIGNIIVALMAGMVPLVAGIYELTLQRANATETVNQLLFFMEESLPYETVLQHFYNSLENIWMWIAGFSAFAFTSTLVREIIKDAEDYDGDKKYGHNTIAVHFGKRYAKIIAFVLTAVMIGVIAYMQYLKFLHQDLLSIVYATFALQVPLCYFVYKLFLANEKKDFTHLSQILKLIMLMGIGYISIFYYLVINL